MVVFAVVMLVVVGLIAYSILTQEIDTADTSASNVPVTPTTSSNAIVTTNNGESTLQEETAGASNNVPATPGNRELTSMENVDNMFADHDFIFVILPASDGDSTMEAIRKVAEAAAKIQAQNIRVGIFTLSRDNPEFANTANIWSIFQFPAVLAFNKDGNGHLVAYGITETKLLQAYLGACGGTSSSCCPPSGSSSNSCCP